MLCVVVYRNLNIASHLGNYVAEARSAPEELQVVCGSGQDKYHAAGDYLSKLAQFAESGGKFHDISEADMRRAQIRFVSRIRDQPFLTAQVRYPKETLEMEELVHFFEGLER